MELLDALEKFETQMRADGRSPHTVANYRRHIELLDGWLGATRHRRALDAIGHEVLAAFLVSGHARASAHGGAKSSASMNSLRTSLRVVFGWLHQAGLARTNAARLIRRAICSPAPPKALSDAEVERLLGALVVAQGPVARRDHLLVELLLSTGIRIGSALALDVDDIDLATSTLTLRECKYDRVERVFFGRELRDHLVGYLARKPRTGPVFRGPQGERLGKRCAQKRIALWLARGGVDGTVHSLRHTFATRLLRKTGDLFLVKRAMLHRSILSTAVYLSVSDERLRAAIIA
jgi:site-specific recombinase XerD